MKKTISCGNCGKNVIEIDERKGGLVVRRGFNGKKSAVGYNGTTEYLTPKCPNCGAFHGQKVVNLAERAKRLEAAGIPLIVRHEYVRN